MLIERNIADDFLYKYQAVMMYLNGGLLPDGALEFAVIRPEIYNCLDEINDAMSGVVGGDFVNNLRRAVYGKFIYLKNYKDGYAFMHIETGAFYMAFALTTRIEELSKEFAVVNTALIPFNGILVCDGLLATYDVTLGKNYIKEIRDAYWKAKRSGSLIRFV